ncbi:methyltransferase domain-containing protein [Candidatus Woesearchaeota archaeon]|nr:methyltransferase domain-containing protein [Candidatus Woesearchaeota archaeon]
MSRPLEVIVTSGGTISKIDDVRHIGNFSRGTTGALIAEEFLKSGATVHYVYGRDAKKPFRSALAVDPTKLREREIERVARAYEEFHQYAPRLHEYSIETFEDYFSTVKKLLTEGTSDVIVLAAAVSDYGGVGCAGKISSDADVLRLELPRNPKIISLVKQWNPRVFQVGFKLLSRSSLDQLIAVAYEQGIKNHSNLTVANTVIDGDFKKRATFFITPEKGVIPVSLPELATRLVELVQQRVSESHYTTKVELHSSYQAGLSAEIAALRNSVKKFWKLNLFEPYLAHADMHFGFVASRVPSSGFLITARGSNKKDLPLDDVVYVPLVDFDSRMVYVNSSGKKASLNANVAAKIFQERPDVNLILHAHVFPGIKNRTVTDYAPGTQEDVDEVMAHLRNGEHSVEQVNHGIISVGATVDDIVATLDVEPAYTHFPELYDAIYQRFQHSPDFIDLVSRVVGPQEAILDLAAGTGEVSRQLQERGYKDLSLADKSVGMLRIAQRKMGAAISVYEATLQNLHIGKKYNAILVRQAINYLRDYESLVTGLKAMYDHLQEDGRLIFNAPNFTGAAEYGEKAFAYQYGDYTVNVNEMNLLEGRVMTHTQRCTLLKNDGSAFKKVYDLNRFGLFTKDEFESALREAGFSSITFLGKGLEAYTSESKTLYGVARK